MTSEALLIRKCKNYAKRNKNAIMLRLSGYNGIPDYLYLTDTKTIFMEFKNGTKGRVSPTQKHIIEKLRNLNKQTILIRNFKEFKDAS